MSYYHTPQTPAQKRADTAEGRAREKKVDHHLAGLRQEAIYELAAQQLHGEVQRGNLSHVPVVLDSLGGVPSLLALAELAILCTSEQLAQLRDALRVGSRPKPRAERHLRNLAKLHLMELAG